MILPHSRRGTIRQKTKMHKTKLSHLLICTYCDSLVFNNNSSFDLSSNSLSVNGDNNCLDDDNEKGKDDRQVDVIDNTDEDKSDMEVLYSILNNLNNHMNNGIRTDEPKDIKTKDGSVGNEFNEVSSSTPQQVGQGNSTISKKINLRRIGSMLRLRRAKDIHNEPAYLYTQRFRPAPVSLPQSSQITSGAPPAQENEDDLNDSAIDDVINQVQNSSNNNRKSQQIYQHSQIYYSKNFDNQNEKIQKKLILTNAEPPITIDQREAKNLQYIEKEIINRASRYQQHCNKINNELQSNSPVNKRLETANLGIKLKNSLVVSSSSRDSTPTLLKLSRSGTPTPLLQSVSAKNKSPEDQKNSNVKELFNSPTKYSSIRSISPEDPIKINNLSQKSPIKDETSNKITIVNNLLEQNEQRIDKNDSKRKSSDFANLIFTNINKVKEKFNTINKQQVFQSEQNGVSGGLYKKKVANKASNIIRKLSLEKKGNNNDLQSISTPGLANSNQKQPKVRRKSMTNIETSLIVAFDETPTKSGMQLSFFEKKTTKSPEINDEEQESAYDRLSHDSLKKFTDNNDNDTDQYWDVPYDQKKLTNQNVSQNRKQDIDINQANKNALSLAEILVKSMPNNKQHALLDGDSPNDSVNNLNIRNSIESDSSLSNKISANLSSSSSMSSSNSNKFICEYTKVSRITKQQQNSGPVSAVAAEIEKLIRTGVNNNSCSSSSSYTATSSSSKSSNTNNEEKSIKSSKASVSSTSGTSSNGVYNSSFQYRRPSEEIIVTIDHGCNDRKNNESFKSKSNLDLAKPHQGGKVLSRNSFNGQNNDDIYVNLDEEKEKIEKSKYYIDSKKNSVSTLMIDQIVASNLITNDKSIEEEFPEPPTQSYLKFTKMDALYSSSGQIASPSPPPPPPPPALPLFPSNSILSNIHLISSSVPSSTSGYEVNDIKNNEMKRNSIAVSGQSIAKLLTLNSETLLLAKQKLRMSGGQNGDSISIGENNTKSLQPSKKYFSSNTEDLESCIKNSNVKKNQFLLQEIQNHRLYNTKKDYVLEYLDRNHNSIAASNTAFYSKQSKFVNSNLIAKIEPENERETNKVISESIESKNEPENIKNPPQTNNNRTANYERFPYLRHKQQQVNTCHYYSSTNSINSAFKRAQSNSCNPNCRNSLTSSTSAAIQQNKDEKVGVKRNNSSSSSAVIPSHDPLTNKSISINNVSQIESPLNLVKTNNHVKLLVKSAKFQKTEPVEKVSKVAIISVKLNENEKTVRLLPKPPQIVPPKQSEAKERFSLIEMKKSELAAAFAGSNSKTSEEEDVSNEESQVYYDNKKNFSENLISFEKKASQANSAKTGIEKRFKQFKPAEKAESELDRVFKKRAMQKL